jgi:hypothetical protein
MRAEAQFAMLMIEQGMPNRREIGLTTKIAGDGMAPVQQGAIHLPSTREKCPEVRN